MSKEEISEALRRCALRCTPQRYAVLEYLLRAPVHATADEIFHAVNANDPRASRATVYNNLHTLTEAGLVREVILEGNAVRFDANLARHHHFVCERCGALEDVEWFDLPGVVRRPDFGQRVIRQFEVIFRGYCAGCAANGEAKAESKKERSEPQSGRILKK